MPTQVNIQELEETWEFPDDATPEQIKETVSRKLDQIRLEEVTPFARHTFPEAFAEPDSLAPVKSESGGDTPPPEATPLLEGMGRAMSNAPTTAFEQTDVDNPQSQRRWMDNPLDPEGERIPFREDSRSLAADIGYTPENIPSGADVQRELGLPKAAQALTVPLVSIDRAIAGMADFLTSPSGMFQTAALAVPVVGTIQAGKFTYDMLRGAMESAHDLGKALTEDEKDAQRISDDIVNIVAGAWMAKKTGEHTLNSVGKYVEQVKATGTPPAKPVLDAFPGGVPEWLKPKPEMVSPILKELAPATARAVEDAAQISKEVSVAADELGLTAKPPEKAAAIDIPDDLSRYSPEDRAKLEELKAQNQPVIELTDRKAGSPTGGLTIYVKPDATKQQIADAWKAKQSSAQKPSGAGKPIVLYEVPQVSGITGKPETGEAARIVWKEPLGKYRVSYTTKEAIAKNEAPKGHDDYNTFQEALDAAKSEGRFSEQQATTEQSSSKIQGAVQPEVGKPVTLTGEQKPAPALEARPEMVGAGAAKAGEVEPTGTSLKNAVGELERASHGLPEAFPTERRSMAAAWVRSGEKIAADPLAGKKLADELKHNPERGMTDDDSALLLRHKVELENAKNQAAEDTITGQTPEAKAEAQARFDELSNQLLDLLDAAKFRGSQWGREGRWRQVLAFEDFSLETMRRDTKMALERELTPEETAEIKRLHERIAALEKQLKEARAASTLEQRTQAGEEAVGGTVKQTHSKSAAEKSKGVERDLEAEQKELVANLKDRFIEEGEITGANSSIRKLMELLVEREGITERLPLETRVHEILQREVAPTITREQAQDLMSGYGKSKLPSQEPAKKIVRDISAQIISVRKLLDYFKGQVPKLTGQLRDAPSDIQRGWIKMVNEAKKVFKLDVPADSARAVKSAIESITTRLKNRLADLKQEVSTRQKIIRERSPSPYNAETLRLRKEIEELQKQHDEIFGGKTDAERLAIAEKVAERQIADLQRQIDSGEIFLKSKQAFGLSSPKLESAKARIEELKFQRQMARESAQPKLEPREAFLLNYELRLRQRAAEYRERLAKGEFEKKAKPERELSPAVLKALAEVETAKTEFRKGLHEFEMAKRSTGKKIWDGIQKTRGSFVNIASSFDFSSPRQMLWALLSNATRLVTNPKQFPNLIGRPFLEMFKAWSSESRAAVIEQRIKNRPNALSGADKTAGIEYSELNTNKFTKYEENAHSVLDEWAALSLRTGNIAKTIATVLPKLAARGIRMSNRAFITSLNSSRAALFDELLRVNFKDRAPTKLELELFGNYVNLATGRGKLNPIVSRVASEVVWAPKLFASRLQLLTGQPLWTGKWAESGRARKMVAKEYARVIISGYLLWAVSRAFDEKDEKNPTSSDFGKIVRGKTRIDPWAGFQQVTTLGARAGTAKTTTLAGDENDIGAAKKYGQRGIWYVFSDFVRSKLRPDVAAAVDIATRTDVIGRPTTPGHVAESLLVPLPMRDIVVIMKEHGFTEGMIIEALGQFGAGISHYEDREAQK